MSHGYRLLVVQPYVPDYRVPFFERLQTTLADDGIELTVYAGRPTGAQRARADDAAARPWMASKPEVPLPRGHRVTSSRMLLEAGRHDGVVLGLRGPSLDVYSALLRGRLGRVDVGLWGHVAPYVKPGHPVDLALERWQMRSCDRVFAYTPGGARFATAAGIPAAKVTTVMNSVDVGPLLQARADADPGEVDRFRREHGLSGSRTLCYVGGLDASKRLDFLAASLDRLWVLDPTVTLLVAGAGDQAALLDPAEQRGQVVRLGYAGAATKAMAARLSRALVMPGRIGLVAVEALALGLPVLTTDWPHHAPEVEYLVEGESRLTARDDPSDFAALMLRAATQPTSGGPFGYPPLDAMVANFARGVVAMRSAPDRTSEHRLR